MERINKDNLNDPQLTDEIFVNRWRKQPHYIDWNRFQLLAKYYKGGNYLDVGCFNSPLPFELANDKAFKGEIHAIDYAPKTIEHMAGLYPEVKYKCHDFTKGLPYEDKYFDYVVIGEVIEHLENPEEMLKECFRVLKPGGILALSTPFAERLQEPAVSNEHLWAFVIDDIIRFTKPYGETEIVLLGGTVKTILSWTRLNSA